MIKPTGYRPTLEELESGNAAVNFGPVVRPKPGMAYKKTTITLFIMLYLFGCLMTNSYCQVYRMKAWSHGLDRPQVNVLVAAATVCWPVYWASVLSQEYIKPVEE